MPFDAKPLDPTIEFGAANVVTMITGRGQMVYWKGCNVTVYEKDSNGQQVTRKLIGNRDGQGLVPQGTKLYITEGYMNEDG
ncbi:hypothetical protein V8F33_009035 [Rhypophila sp. PSN 637]